jgi:hypothetical protein
MYFIVYVLFVLVLLKTFYAKMHGMESFKVFLTSTSTDAYCEYYANILSKVCTFFVFAFFDV